MTLTPCTAKKFEVRREEMHAAADYHGMEGMRDTDQVITTRELARWAKAAGIDWNALEDSAYDSLMGKASGAGVIFGNTGGVMEAALRTAYAYLTGQTRPGIPAAAQTRSAGMKACGKPRCSIGDLTLQVAVVYGTANARRFPGADEGKRQAVPLCGGDGLSGRLHRRRRTAQGSDERMPMRSARAALRPSTGGTRP